MKLENKIDDVKDTKNNNNVTKTKIFAQQFLKPENNNCLNITKATTAYFIIMMFSTCCMYTINTLIPTDGQSRLIAYWLLFFCFVILNLCIVWMMGFDMKKFCSLKNNPSDCQNDNSDITGNNKKLGDKTEGDDVSVKTRTKILMTLAKDMILEINELKKIEKNNK